MVEFRVMQAPFPKGCAILNCGLSMFHDSERAVDVSGKSCRVYRLIQVYHLGLKAGHPWKGDAPDFGEVRKYG